MKLRHKWLYLGLMLCLTLFLCGLFYLTAACHSWLVFFQNLSLISIWVRLLIWGLFWLVITLPFLIKYKKFRLGINCLMIFIALNAMLDGYHIIQIVRISNNFKTAKQLICARYGVHQNVKRKLAKTVRLKSPHVYGSPDQSNWVRFNKWVNGFEVLTTRNNDHIVTMKHWVISPGELFWLFNQQGQPEYILYRWSYDQEDLDKIYIINLKTKQTTLLASGRWLYGDCV